MPMKHFFVEYVLSLRGFGGYRLLHLKSICFAQALPPIFPYRSLTFPSSQWGMVF